MTVNGILATWMLAAALGAAPQQGGWQDNYSDALLAARADRKPLLVVLDKPGQPQQAMQQVSHARAESSTLLENYHLCHIDVSTEYGRRVAGVFGAKSFPYTVITDRPAKKIIFRKGSAFSDAQWTATLADYRRGTRPVGLSSLNMASAAHGANDCPS